MVSDKEEPWLEGIVGDDARRLITSDAPLIRVVAGPGAGKTTCLKRRVQRLVERTGVRSSSIFVGTFTRAIANELKDELGDSINVQTLHSLAYRLLRENTQACQGMRLRFLLTYEEDAMLYDIAPQVLTIKDQRERRKALRRLQSARSERVEYADATFAGVVHSWLQRHGGMLIGEVVHLAVTGLEGQDITPGQFDHVVVDEYQDLTAAEQALVELIWSRSGSLVVMGDNNQSIYGFRFNHPDGIDEFSGRWTEPAPLDVSLPDNRRCGEAILKVANLMMAEAGSSNEPMVAASGRPGNVTLVHWPTLQDEIEGLASYVVSRPEQSFLVLVPRRFIGYRLKEAIGEDARTAFHEEVLEHAIAQERFALGSALGDPTDLVAVRSWLGFRGTAHEQADHRNAQAYASLPCHLDAPTLVARLANHELAVNGPGGWNVQQRAEQLHRLLLEAASSSLGSVIESIFDSGMAHDEADAEKRRWLDVDLSTLRVAALSVASSLAVPSLARVLSVLRYRIATRAPLLPDDTEPRVRIMTLHSAKGLEASNVIVAGIADQIMPGRTTDAQDIAEQRRLLYVAVTRAKERLTISWPRLIPYADAAASGIRIQGIVTIHGQRMVRTSRTSLLPQALPGGAAGAAWLVRKRRSPSDVRVI